MSAREVLIKWRKLTHSPQWAAAKKLKVSEAVYKNWEQGRTKIPEHIKAQVTEWVNSPPHYGYEHEAFMGRGLHRQWMARPTRT